MKIKYKFANETLEIEVTEEWGSILIDLDRQEYNNNHKETRRHCPLSAYSYEGEVFSVEDENLTKLIEDTEPGKLLAAILKLSPKQQELIRSIYIDKISVNEYAKRLSMPNKKCRKTPKKFCVFLPKNISVSLLKKSVDNVLFLFHKFFPLF